MRNNIFIHYGHDNFDLSKFNKIKNKTYMSKPCGGLWVCPINSTKSWKDFCISEDFRLNSFNSSFKISFNNNAKIYKINSLQDINNLPTFTIGKIEEPLINFEKISEEYDAVWLTAKGYTEIFNSDIIDMLGWDCESIIIFNTNCFKIIK